MKALLYCTKAKPYLYRTPEVMNFAGTFFTYSSNKNLENCTLNGTIVAKCDIDLITKNDLVFDRALNEETQLLLSDIVNYVRDKEYYCLHLSNIEVFVKPKDLSEYCTLETEQYAYFDWQGYHHQLREKELKKAPQNMMVVYEKNITINHLGNFLNRKYILISIQPQWLEKILNGKKTVEVRKKILNCMKELVE